MKKNRIKLITMVGIFSAIAFVLQVLGSMFPKVAGFLEIEFSDLPALIISLALGPVAGVCVELIKNLLHCTITSTGFIGEIANFLINGSFVFICGSIYKFRKTKKGALISLISATISLVLIGILVNVYFMLPLFEFTKHMDINERYALATTIMAPFNLVRGSILSLITIFIYKKISGLLK